MAANIAVRNMDDAEQAAHAWLQTNYLDNSIRFEPDGNCPPDFVLDDTLAIEVRRLNETRSDPAGIKPIGLEQDTLRLHKILNGIFEKLKCHDGQQFMVHLRITDPAQLIFDKKCLKEDLIKVHADLLGKEKTTEHSGFQLDWIPWKFEDIFHAVYLASTEHDGAGGFLEQVYASNIERLIAEKNHKIGKNAQKQYAHWWLVLVDYITPPTQYGHRFNFTVNKLRFERVVVIDRNSNLVLER